MKLLLPSLDYFIVGLFFLVTFLIGLAERKKLTIEDYWVNGRKTNKFILVATTLSTFIGAGAILGNAGVAYSGGGLATLVIAGSYFFYFLIFSRFFAPRIKEFGDQHKAYTVADFFAVRYSNKVRVMGAVVNLVSWALYLALQMLAIGTFVSVFVGLNPTMGTIIGGLIVISYTAVGGLRADIRTDVFQFFVMLFLLLIFLPLIIERAGGLGVIADLPLSFLNGTEFAPAYVLILAFFFLGAGVLTSADMWQRAYAGDTAKNVRWATGVSSVFVLLFLIMAALFGIYGKILLPDEGSNHVIPELLNLTLPPGLFGLILAGFFAAILSSADTVLLVTSMTVVHDLYHKTLQKDLTPEKVLKISRWMTFVLGIVGLVVALIVFDIVHLSIEAVSFYVALLPAIVFGFYSKSPAKAAAFWSIVVGFCTIIAFLFIAPVQAFIPGLIMSFLTFFVVNAFELHQMPTTDSDTSRGSQRGSTRS